MIDGAGGRGMNGEDICGVSRGKGLEGEGMLERMRGLGFEEVFW